MASPRSRSGLSHLPPGSGCSLRVFWGPYARPAPRTQAWTLPAKLRMFSPADLLRWRPHPPGAGKRNPLFCVLTEQSSAGPKGQSSCLPIPKPTRPCLVGAAPPVLFSLMQGSDSSVSLSSALCCFVWPWVGMGCDCEIGVQASEHSPSCRCYSSEAKQIQSMVSLLGSLSRHSSVPEVVKPEPHSSAPAGAS